MKLVIDDEWLCFAGKFFASPEICVYPGGVRKEFF